MLRCTSPAWLACFVALFVGTLPAHAAPADQAPKPAVFLGKPLDHWTAQAAAQPRQEPVDKIAKALTAALQTGDLPQQIAAIDALQLLGPDAQGRGRRARRHPRHAARLAGGRRDGRADRIGKGSCADPDHRV